MIEFKVFKKSKKTNARLGILETPHGKIETPSLVAVGTQATVKTLISEEVVEAKAQVMICNTFHLHLKPGENVVRTAGGLHRFMNWQRPLMTDSGGFQVFSFGFGRDWKMGKITKNREHLELIQKTNQPKFVKITEEGVYFHSPLDGKKLFLGPRESIKIQEQLGADIIFAFDECTSPLSSVAYVREAVRRTHQWAKTCLSAKKSKQALFGVVQGSRIKTLRQESAKEINALGFDGFGIGGDFGGNKKEMQRMLSWTLPHLDERKPRHLLGIGHLKDIEPIIQSGIDLFDCTVPTHYARHGVAFTSFRPLNLKQAAFLKQKKPLDQKCTCKVCQHYTRSYVSHLLRAGEITALRLLTFHNLFFFNSYIESLREKIKEGKI